LIISIIFLYSSLCYANSTEVSVNETYKKLCWLLKENTDEAYVIKYGCDSLNYGVEIMTKAPDSLEAFLTIFIINDVFDRCNEKDIISKVYNNIKEKHLLHLEEPDFEPGEKLIFLIMYSAGTGAKLARELKENQLKTINALKIMKDSCSDKNYAALANAMLFWTKNEQERMQYMKNFLDKFPDHPAIPLVKLSYVCYLHNNDPKKCIEEIDELLKKYGNIKLPNEWNYSANCYEEMVQCYINLKDYDNAMKYYELIKKEAPGIWSLSEMKRYIDYINPQNPDKANMEEENK